MKTHPLNKMDIPVVATLACYGFYMVAIACFIPRRATDGQGVGSSRGKITSGTKKSVAK